jgi:polyhydroxyalkanoate synthesis regulator phasin
MPKKKNDDDPKAQKERFEKTVQELIDAGELDPTAAAAVLDGLVKKAKGNASSG